MAAITEAHAARIVSLCAAVRSDRALIKVLDRTKEVFVSTTELKGPGESYDKPPVDRGRFLKSSRLGSAVVGELKRAVELRIASNIRELRQLNASVPAETA